MPIRALPICRSITNTLAGTSTIPRIDLMSVSSELSEIGNGGAIAINGRTPWPVISPTNTSPVPELFAELGNQSQVKCSGTNSPGLSCKPAAWLMLLLASSADVAATKLKSAWSESSSAINASIC